ncbi:hypothetical protein PHYSODRAFT_302808 [Phytophthora sojae]|uniref:Transmembrane protein n=1 Tax=Phytophthora sojae (strain P6497) TaxID=1094619 RepID=G4ZSC7_PHYSP|nr:hypothetical protein PHYSODRAFT_302808 [Phytophthora sojae]EGZ13023.1 hypothetical protein PHYSODRAFT_302808 [Phytophthora sojae]|eukprot:XP_009530452.1 hypothetical protein PHYSODRAFT_302808 [Phytophthora sojae]
MRVKPSVSIPLVMAMLLLVLQFPAKTNANSLRRGGIVTPSSPVILPAVKTEVPVQRQRTVQDELSQVFAAAPTISSGPTKGRKGTGDACIGPVCGLGLFFASIGLTFVACFVVIYIADKRYDRVHNARRRQDKYYESSRKRRPSSGHLDFRRNCAGSALRSPTAMRRRAAQ